MLLLRLSRELLLRYAERQFLGLLFQEPPRSRFIARPALTLADRASLNQQRSAAAVAKYRRGPDGLPNFANFG